MEMSTYRYRVVGANIVYLRLIKNIGQDELAEHAGISQAYISKIERGKVSSYSLSTLFAIADALGVEPAVLLRESRD